MCFIIPAINPSIQSTCGCQSVFNNLRATGAGLPKPLNRQRLVRAVLLSIQLGRLPCLLAPVGNLGNNLALCFCTSFPPPPPPPPPPVISGYMFLAAMDLPTVQNSLAVSYRFTASLNCCIYKGEKHNNEH
ncbi:hypothetical protein K503DRAFT_587860 [Rhizopogon vinicolor AM-OR11-026]|uniref:Uncharacterized protein n=1 Tax=Rhizopogon vinicolor AM-OR11-026 TaxID=1314800 RepID=A0A1B7MJB6_9AGAM|nr:hypothetical protein K503DRAFT_587860 [Rhizopogon vinicolor AM-OR11-026]